MVALKLKVARLSNTTTMLAEFKCCSIVFGEGFNMIAECSYCLGVVEHLTLNRSIPLACLVGLEWNVVTTGKGFCIAT